ncbi:serine protease inhibitor [Arthrobacter alpinus]|uniref:serine protease inhibitor n=1 Tax=Arthrobacter alpinus TaxID=656366 RepID=UPI003138AA10
MSSRLAATVLLLSVVAVVAGCAQQQPGGDATGTPPVTATPPTSIPSKTTSPPSSTPSATGIDLTITLTESPEAAPRTFRLVADGSTPAPESTLPDSAAALDAVEQHGEKIFFALPDPNRICTQQYGGPQIAVVTGSFHGREVEATFSRTDGCEISRWQALAPLFGALSGGSGAV